MDAQQIIEYIRTSEKKTPVKVYVWEKTPVAFPNCHEFPAGDGCKIVFGDWKDVAPVLQANEFRHLEIENNCRNSAIPMLDMKDIPARIEPGAVIREQVQIGKNAVIMMGAIINIGAVIGDGTMIDMGAVLGGRANAVVIEGCHIGENAVVAAGAIVVSDVPANAVVAGCPAKIIKMKDEKTAGKTALVDALREL